MAALRTPVTQKSRPKNTTAAQSVGPDDRKTVTDPLSARARFHRFVASQIGDDSSADVLLQKSVPRALEQSAKLRRGESAVAWFYRILRNAIVDHYRTLGAEHRRTERLLTAMHRENDVSTPPPDWDAAIVACFRGLLPSLEPRYAEVIRRVDLQREPKGAVAGEMKLSAATMDVLLHRARQSLRRQLEIFCGS